MKTIRLTAVESKIYDNGDDEQINRLMANLRSRYGRIAAGDPVDTEVIHPDGFVVEQYTSRYVREG